MSGSTILIVDDEPTNLSVLNQLLSPEHTVRACRSGEQALRAAVGDPQPDLILLDVMMPGMDGYAVIENLRGDVRTCDIPVIFVTALDDDVEEEHGLALGAVDYITKPITPAVVQARVRAHLEIKQARDRLKSQNDWLEAEVERRMRENLLVQELSLGLLAELAETRDADTGNHILRTKAFIGVLARQLYATSSYRPQLAEPRLTRIVKASPLHDIGKVAIPDRILLKPGKLTPEEWAIMKTHARIGGEVIRRAIHKTLLVNRDQTGDKPSSLAFLETAEVIATSHHERWDGSGYPDGLSGTDIPLPARLMALADVYDALTAPRVYKRPWTLDEAAEHLRAEAGAHFDPEIVEAFLVVRKDFETIQRTLQDEEPREGGVIGGTPAAGAAGPA